MCMLFVSFLKCKKKGFLLAEMALAEVAEAETENSPGLFRLFSSTLNFYFKNRSALNIYSVLEIHLNLGFVMGQHEWANQDVLSVSK